MNQYGQQAREHWRRWLPSRYAAIDDPDQYFTELGRTVARQVVRAWDARLAQNGASSAETQVQRQVRFSRARFEAESHVLDEWVWLEPEPGVDEDDDPEPDDADLETEGEFAARQGEALRHDQWVSRTATGLLDGQIDAADVDATGLRAVVEYLGGPEVLPLLNGASEVSDLGQDRGSSR